MGDPGWLILKRLHRCDEIGVAAGPGIADARHRCSVPGLPAAGSPHKDWQLCRTGLAVEDEKWNVQFWTAATHGAPAFISADVVKTPLQNPSPLLLRSYVAE